MHIESGPAANRVAGRHANPLSSRSGCGGRYAAPGTPVCFSGQCV